MKNETTHRHIVDATPDGLRLVAFSAAAIVVVACFICGTIVACHALAGHYKVESHRTTIEARP